MKNLLITTIIAAIPMISSPAFAADEINVSTGISAAGAPLAVHGADPVMLLDSNQVVSGSAQHSLTHDGASYYFASAESKEMFEANPAKYTPEHGGFCSYGVSVGKKFDGNPNHYLVHDGKLFLFLNAKTRELFMEDAAGTREIADKNWDQIEHVAVGDL